MNPIHQARKDIKYLTSLVRDLTALDEELERVGGLDKILAEKREALKGIERGISERSDDLKKIEAEILKAKGREQDHLRAVDVAREMAENAQAGAGKDVSSIIANARKQANEIIQSAQVRTADHHAAEQAAKEAEAKAVRAYADAEKRLATIQAEIARIKSNL